MNIPAPAGSYNLQYLKMTGIFGNKSLAIGLALAGIALGAAACSQHDESPSKKIDPSGRKAGNVCIKVSQPVGTRTFIDGAALDRTVWSELDVIGVYWRERGNSAAPDGQPFSYFREYADETLFSADVADVAAGDYTYYGAYPVPETVSGTTVTYTLPSTQDGTYDMADYDIRNEATHAAYKGNLDFLIAEPFDAGSLTDGGEVALNFVRQCHVLRIQVPTGRNRLGNDIGKLRIEFPSNVVGTMTMDLADPHAVPALSNGSSTIIADLRKSVSESAAGETDPDKYIWIFVCPGDIDGQVTFTGFDVSGGMSKKVSVAMNKTLEAGRITPIDLTIPAEAPVSWIDLSIGDYSRLGETPNSFTVKAPEGVLFRNGLNEQTFQKNGNGQYRLEFYYEYGDVSFGDIINSEGLDITYDTPNAIVSDHISVTTAAESGVAKSLTLPYLFEEDFSAVTAFSYDAGSSDEGGYAFDDYGLPGWTGARVASSSGRMSCVSSRAAIIVIISYASYSGRIDSPQFSNLKPNSKITVKVSFKGGLNSSTGRWAGGYTTGNAGTIAGGTGLQATVTSATNSPNNSGYNYTATTLPTLSFNIPNCTNQHRASWRVTNSASLFTTGNYYFYLDDVKATIVP